MPIFFFTGRKFVQTKHTSAADVKDAFNCKELIDSDGLDDWLKLGNDVYIYEKLYSYDAGRKPRMNWYKSLDAAYNSYWKQMEKV